MVVGKDGVCYAPPLSAIDAFQQFAAPQTCLFLIPMYASDHVVLQHRLRSEM